MVNTAPHTSSSQSSKTSSGRASSASPDTENPLQKTEAIEQWFKMHAHTRPKETPKRLLAHISIALAVAAVAVAGYSWDAQRQYAVKKKMVEATPYITLGDSASLKKAQTILRSALEIRSYSPAVAQMAETSAVLWALHGIQEAQQDALTYTTKASNKNIQSAERYAAEMWTALAQAKPQEAITLGQKVLSLGVVSEKVLFPLGIAQQSLGFLEEGIENIRKAYGLKPSAAVYATALGDAYDDAFDPRNAALYWDSAYKTHPEDVAAMAQSVLARIRNGEAAASIEKDLTALQSLQKNVLAPRDLERIAIAQSALLERKGLYAEALQALPRSQRTLSTQIRLLAASGQTTQAQALFEQSVAPNAMSYATAFETLEHWTAFLTPAKTVDVFEKRLSSHKNHLTWQLLTAQAYMHAGNLPQAKNLFESVLKTHPNSAEALLGMAQVEMAQQHKDEAFKWFEQAVALKPIFPELYESIGVLYLSLGASQDAHAQFEGAEKMFVATSTPSWRVAVFFQRIQEAAAKHPSAKALGLKWAEHARAYGAGSTS